MDEELIRNYFRQIVSALHYFHEVKGVAHRGIKPSNLMLENNTEKIRLCDFGLA